MAKNPDSLADDSEYNSDGSEDDTDEAVKQNEPAQGVVKTYLANLKAGAILDTSPSPIFSMSKAAKSAAGLSPEPLYYPSVFLWLPHLLADKPLTCQNEYCSNHGSKGKSLSIKGFNDNPIAHHVISLDRSYYVMTQ